MNPVRSAYIVATSHEQAQRVVKEYVKTAQHACAAMWTVLLVTEKDLVDISTSVFDSISAAAKKITLGPAGKTLHPGDIFFLPQVIVSALPNDQEYLVFRDQRGLSGKKVFEAVQETAPDTSSVKEASFEALYSRYSELFKEGDVTHIKREQMLEAGDEGVRLMLAQLYKNPPSTADVFEKEIPEGGLDPEICKLGSILLDREVTQYDKEVVFSLVAVRHEVSDEAFDALTKLIETPPKPNQALIDLMKRRPRWD